MRKRQKMKNRYRRFSFLSDIEGMKNALGEMRGLFFPKQPVLVHMAHAAEADPLPDEEWFIRTLTEKLRSHPDNSMEYPFSGERMFDDPIVGFVRGNDPIFTKFKEIIGPHHLTPWEILRWQADRNCVKPPDPDEISVVSFVMPLTKKTRVENAAARNWPSERWAQTRLNGEIFSQTMVREIVTSLMDRGILAVSPDVTPLFNKKRYPDVGWASPWSHRHVAYAAGLGTFGLHDFFITEKGAAHRLGSFVVNLKLSSNRQRPDDIHAYCLHYQGYRCVECVKRCPVHAVTLDHGHDKEACYRKVAESLYYCNKNYHIFIYGCGLCSVGVPCESGIPVKKSLHKMPVTSRIF